MQKLHILAQITAKPGRAEDVRAALQALTAPSLGEAGCIRYTPYESDQTGRFFVDEIWESREALDAHMKTPHFREVEARFPELLEGSLVIDVLRPIG